MNYLYYIHFLIPLSVILLPLLPIKYLKYIFWYPMIYFLIWYIFDGCPITQSTPVDEVNADPDNFLLPIFRKYVNKDMTSNQSNHIVSFCISLSIVLSAFKVIFYRRRK
jgi:hypothetical protein